jgi:LuxR family transcriptional regulator, maltose regulon positive regulatory protein
MPTPLLTTKLFIPQPRAKIINRSRLLDQINQGLDHALVLISAPAGFGKTTLLSTWVQETEKPVAWVSLDQSDNDPARFLAYVLTALQSVIPNLGAEILENLLSPQPDYSETSLIKILNEISIANTQELILVLDDYHLVTIPAVNNITNFLLNNLPQGMHLIIITRADPALPLPRLRGQGELVEIRQNDLRFTFAEVTEFINQTLGSNLSPMDVTALTNRTEGWIAGLQMAAISMAGKSDNSQFIQEFTGSDRYILDYLMDEVFQLQPTETQNFLLLTSLVNRFTAALCNVLTEAQNSQEILERFERDNLFIIPLDNNRIWYRYHQLFADLLQNRLIQEQSENIPQLHDRASRWFEDQGSINEAIQHSLAAKNYERAADLLDQIAEETLMRSEIKTFLSWTREIPTAVITKRPNLGLGMAWALVISGNSLDNSEKILDEITCNTAELKGRRNVVLASIAIFRGQLTEARELAESTLSQLPETDVRLREMAHWTINFTNVLESSPDEGIRTLMKIVDANRASGNLLGWAAAIWQISRLYSQQGKLSQAKLILEQVLERARDFQGELLPIAGEALMGLGELYREANQFQQAESYLKKGITLSQKGRGVTAYLGYISLARVKIGQADIASADNLFKEAKLSAVHGFDQLLTEASAAKAKILIGDIETAETWLTERGWVMGELAEGETGDLINKHLRKYEQILHARVLLAHNQNNQALKTLQTIQEKMQQQQRIDLLIEIQVLKALAFQALGNTDEALTTLETALGWVEPDCHCRVFVDEGQAIVPLLEAAFLHDLHPQYVNKLLDLLSPVSEKIDPQIPALADPLSDREMEVLRMLPTKLTAPEIADQLYVAESTVRTHIKRIYSKLNVNRRFDAIERAKELGIL